MAPENPNGVRAAFAGMLRTPEWNALHAGDSIVKVGYIGVCTFVVLSALQLRRPAGSALKVSAYGTLPLFLAESWDNSLREKTASTLERAQGTETSKPLITHPLKNIDSRPSLLLGGIAAATLASRIRKPWTIFGWKRYVGAFSIGASLCTTGHAAYLASQIPREDFEIYDRQQLVQQRARQNRFAFGGSYPREMHDRATPNGFGMRGTERAGQGLAGSAPGRSGGPMGNGEANSRDTKSKNESGKLPKPGPYLQEELSVEPGKRIPIANTNYEWQSDRPIQELEEFIAVMQQERRRLALEAERTWSFLSHKEANFYNTKFNTPAETIEARLYLETLGSLHIKTLARATSCDWMIGDARKRIQQQKSAESNPARTVTWRTGCSEAASSTSPDCALLLARMLDKQLRQFQEEAEGVQHAMDSTIISDHLQQEEPEMEQKMLQALKDLKDYQDELSLSRRVFAKVQADLQRPR